MRLGCAELVMAGLPSVARWPMSERPARRKASLISADDGPPTPSADLAARRRTACGHHRRALGADRVPARRAHWWTFLPSADAARPRQAARATEVAARFRRDRGRRAHRVGPRGGPGHGCRRHALPAHADTVRTGDLPDRGVRRYRDPE